MDELMSSTLWRLSMVMALAFIMVFFSVGVNMDFVTPATYADQPDEDYARQLGTNDNHDNANNSVSSLEPLDISLKSNDGDDEDSNAENRIPHQTAFEDDLVRCSIHALPDREKLQKYWSKQSPPKMINCSPSIFRKYFAENHHFYREGVWLAPNETYPENLVFYPNDCLLDETAIQQRNFKNWIKHNKIKKILFHGDSNGHFYFQSLMTFFAERYSECALVREEKGSEPHDYDPYFTIPGYQRVQKYKGCTHCFAMTYVCSGARGSTDDRGDAIVIEYIGMIRIIDDKLYYEKTRNSSAKKLPKRHTFLEYMFRDYFPHTGMPDLWIMSPPFHHESWSVNYEQHEANMKVFVRLLDELKPRDTKLLVLADSRECPVLQPRWAFEDFMAVSNESKNEVLHAMNQILYNALEDQLTSDSSNVLGFMDMGVLSCPFTCRWHKDGAHMVQGWYDMQIKYIFQYLCTENIL